MSPVARRLVLYLFLDDFQPIYSLYAVFAVTRGLSLGQISALLATWSITAFVLEVPCGVIGDRYERRFVLAAGQTVRALGFLIWMIFPTFFGFLAGFLLWGFKSALQSGTYEALLYDELKIFDSQAQFGRVFGRAVAATQVAQVGSALIASLLAQVGFRTVLTVSVLVGLGTAIVAVTLPKAPHVRPVEGARYFSLLRLGLHTIRRNRTVAVVVIFTGFAVGMSAVDEFYNLLWSERGASPSVISLSWAFVALSAATGGAFAHRLVRQHFSLTVPFLLMAGWAYAIFFAAHGGLVVAVLSIAVADAFMLGIHVITQELLQRSIVVDARATIASVSSFVTEFVALTVFFVVGVLSRSVGLPTAMSVIAVVAGVTVVGFAFLARKWQPAS